MSDTPQYAVGWFTLALINAGLAQGKNRSGLNWFLLSVLLGPFATFAIVCFEKLDSDGSPRKFRLRDDDRSPPEPL